MNILFDIAHPADVHMFRHVRNNLLEKNHNVIFMARDKDVVIELLNRYKIPFKKGTKASKGVIGLSTEVMCWFFKAFSIIWKNKIDIAVSLSSPATAWAAKLQGVPHIMFNDTETGIAQLRMARPATQYIYTPKCLLSNWGSKQVRYNGIHDLAYLSPKYFTPSNDKPLKNSKYAILRFVSWNAAHDWNAKTTTQEFQNKICSIIKEKMNIFISAEGDLPKHLEQFRLKISPSKFHDAMANASLVVGDGATTATEAAVMGIPSIYISTFANSLGYCKLLNSYDLLISVKDEDEGIKAIKKLIENPRFKYRKKRVKELLHDSIDVVNYMTKKILDISHS